MASGLRGASSLSAINGPASEANSAAGRRGVRRKRHWSRCDFRSRDLPVLDAIVRYFDESDDPFEPYIPNVDTFAKITGMDPGQVGRAVRALSPRFIETVDATRDDLLDVSIMGVTDEARWAVGQWPTPETVADRIVAALLEAADREPDERKRTKLRAAAETLGSLGRDLLINVAANVATKPIGL